MCHQGSDPCGIKGVTQEPSGIKIIPTSTAKLTICLRHIVTVTIWRLKSLQRGHIMFTFPPTHTCYFWPDRLEACFKPLGLQVQVHAMAAQAFDTLA